MHFIEGLRSGSFQWKGRSPRGCRSGNAEFRKHIVHFIDTSFRANSAEFRVIFVLCLPSSISDFQFGRTVPGILDPDGGHSSTHVYLDHRTILHDRISARG